LIAGEFRLNKRLKKRSGPFLNDISSSKIFIFPR
jgi:hypothetical protein